MDVYDTVQSLLLISVKVVGEIKAKVLNCVRGRRPQARDRNHRLNPGSKETGSVRWGKRVPATICAISDAIDWAEEIMKEIDGRWPAR